MGRLVTPKVFLVGETTMLDSDLKEYLEYTDQLEFWEEVESARTEGISNMEIMCSFFAKACYKSLTNRKNANISRVRAIADNIKGTFNSGHGSVFEHVWWNFMITDCSRVFTHELCRHRVGTAFSQTSGRYVRPVDEDGNGVLDIVFDPILEPVRKEYEEYIAWLEAHYQSMVMKMGLDEMKNFDSKKKATSALRRELPNGQSNEMGFSCNLRQLRQLVTLRTARFAEWEIRNVFYQIYLKIKDRCPLVFHGAKENMYDGIPEISGMKLQPWERDISNYSVEELQDELDQRKASTPGEQP